MIKCENKECGKWLHEACLVEDALQRQWGRLTAKRAESNDTSNAETRTELSDAIQVTATPKGGEKSNGIPPSTGKKKGKGKKGRGASGAKPWEGSLEGKLELKGTISDTEAKSDKTSEEEKTPEDISITGKVIITDLRGPSTVTVEENAECLFCRQPIT